MENTSTQIVVTLKLSFQCRITIGYFFPQEIFEMPKCVPPFLNHVLSK